MNENRTIKEEHSKWKVGKPNGFQNEHLYLGTLKQVTLGSWQLDLYYDEKSKPVCMLIRNQL